MNEQLRSLEVELAGELHGDAKMRILYATDASAYRELPLAVAFPKDVQDLQLLIAFARKEGVSLIPRAAGTSLAGQVVGKGIVVDVSRHFTAIQEINSAEKWVRVQPGVIRDELNLALQPVGLYFGPETSTANRAMIGGMVGNNSCGSNSLVYGSTREHTLEIEALLSDGSAVTFKALSFDDFCDKCSLTSLEGDIYRHMRSLLGDYSNQEEIRRQYPKKEVTRRNTGYAIDLLLASDPFTAGADPFNFCKLICGSEGTLAFITSVKLQLVEVPQQPSVLLCAHFKTVDEALLANLVALQYKPLVSELMDSYILDCTKNNLEQRENRFFVQGEPGAILVLEYADDRLEAVYEKIDVVEKAMRQQGLGYHFPKVTGSDKKRVWNLRKAGLGLLSNTPGDEKPVAVIEDTAVAVDDLPAYIAEFNRILSAHGLYSVHYAHAATGELHLRPILNLKTEEGRSQFRLVATEIAKLVKKYRGSLSGEHGDGRLRGEFIPLMIGQHNYGLLQSIKKQWDPQGIFNPGKIVDTAAMDSFLRYDQVKPFRQEIPSVFRYAGQHILQHAEQCNGSGDCRKTELSGGTMCPSYMATRREEDTTRARANILREMLSRSEKANPFDHQEIKEVMDLCLSCKGCKAECPSSVDMAKLKADFQQAYYDANGVPMRNWLIGHVDRMTRLVAPVSGLYNWAIAHPFFGRQVKQFLGFAPQRTLPAIAKQSLYAWFSKRRQQPATQQKQVYFFFDEFTNHHEVEIGKKAILLLEALGYGVLAVKHPASGRALISKGFLREAKELANEQVALFAPLLQDDHYLVGVEPSAILSFRDEYVDLVDEEHIGDAKSLARRALTIEEFLYQEQAAGAFTVDCFHEEPKHMLLHAHCQQKAWGLQDKLAALLRFPKNYTVEVVPSGCCGMAGSFGYEQEHYALSQQIGELVLFPKLRQKSESTVVVAPGTSCRQQIKEGLAQQALHPVEILFAALKAKG
ncbi:FAD-binding and (Fe-S)-binding domain-containing protein [Sphingobacterium bambusae]|uniref:FAD-binding and (Fe-S)-binding domain-containing protein n=1 Tax=Sphingobacterium bambusae TaxID=662858 RepID=A0ABW6BDR4_9SPHI|nr:FAD-linked oxidase C-terminal domain-containing protein [Sphingobacterium bambusae]WPL46838.1 FAD-linked oxidase C-terminal domain-containing protein [Sphingobacterium bambusae]